ncbi:styrene monooxygenase/indole monooxygenase family protein [Burkholderia sp. A1]|uniref:styrene monooxygenase/indole monooxygenase family protein n=1 Tax=Burkholderia sp. A1 TaxID=148446 RepID=UPI000468D733|nr:styrene monooxygenase/indole monooxygenase family protein [Burkholderia sp. A1]
MKEVDKPLPAGASRRIAVVGAGQAGLQTSLALLARGHAVTLVAERDADDVERGRVMSSQCLFGSALRLEREAGIEHGRDACPPINAISFAVADPHSPNGKAIAWRGALTRGAAAIDQRIKFAAALRSVRAKGGEVRIATADVALLEELAASHELVLVATGKGELGQLFERDAVRSVFRGPQRSLALTFLHCDGRVGPADAVSFNVVPGAGEIFVMPALTHSGPCHVAVFEAMPGGPLDGWRDVRSATAHLSRSLELLRRFTPWELDACRYVELTDANGTLTGSVTPTVRHPIAILPSGRAVLGMGDAVVLHDPITGQGANSAAKCSASYVASIGARGSLPFGHDWMLSTFAAYWREAVYTVQWSNSLLMAPAPHVLGLFGAAQRNPALAARIADGFDDPSSLFPAWTDPDACDALRYSVGA